MRSYSITRRLVFWLTIAIAAFWLAAAALGTWVMNDEFGEIFDSSMQETADRLLPLVMDDLMHIEPSVVPLRLQDSSGTTDGHLVYQVREASGRVLMHSFDADATPFKAPLHRGFWEDDAARVFTTATADGKIFVQVADSLDHRMEAMQEGALALLSPALVLIPISVAVMLFIVRRVIAPVTQLRRAIAAKDGGNLSPISVDRLPSELRPIANSINRLLARLSAALGAEREFTANSAHELRTPIAGAIAQTQVLIAALAADQPEVRQRALLIEAALKRLASLTEKLLQLSRAEAGIGLEDAPRDLLPIARMVVEDFQRQTGTRRSVDLVIGDGAALNCPMSPDAFAIVLRNLIENALVHGADDAPVCVRVDGDGKLVVANVARHYAPDEIEAMRRRFVRGNPTAPGSGLGLSIIDRLLSQVGASLALVSRPRDGRAVFEAIVDFAGTTTAKP